MVNTLCIVQARLTSSRLPNKVLMPLAGKTILEHVNERLSRVKGIDKVVFAIPENQLNNRLEAFLEEKGISYFRGSENDVLDRFYQCAIKYSPKIVVRATCDNPLVDIELAETMLRSFGDNDYMHGKTCSLGTAVEIFKMSALTEAFHNASTSIEHEHVTPYIWKRPDVYKVEMYPYVGPSFRLTVDEDKDYELMNLIYDEMYKGSPICNELVYDFLSRHPELVEINKSVEQVPV